MKDDASHALLHEAQELGYEARSASSDHAALKLWLRMLACSRQIESEIRRRLRAQFGISLARFDYMAQLYRHRDGLKMNKLSRYLMVTGGNITGLTDELEREELVQREGDPTDRRAWLVRLTAKGRTAFERMAQMHEAWILEMFVGLDDKTLRHLHQTLGTLRVQLLQLDRTEEQI
jgi:DNA-binding MarR family transcriptional regulator